ncbi:hypothetical protein [Fodinibius sediminis]|uniref:Hook-length control protein FliK n=1 Tax=Fodinibius sediminis TaxID=1214077 RepID=A0A521CJ17_9BACT|nr:hypothetical protein [Fodinibius sediminis]SMO59375.1 hypothetical protein SAMN06265218_106109 [Fodinibius sediminis]
MNLLSTLISAHTSSPGTATGAGNSSMQKLPGEKSNSFSKFLMRFLGMGASQTTEVASALQPPEADKEFSLNPMPRQGKQHPDAASPLSVPGGNITGHEEGGKQSSETAASVPGKGQTDTSGDERPADQAPPSTSRPQAEKTEDSLQKTAGAAADTRLPVDTDKREATTGTPSQRPGAVPSTPGEGAGQPQNGNTDTVTTRKAGSSNSRTGGKVMTSPVLDSSSQKGSPAPETTRQNTSVKNPAPMNSGKTRADSDRPAWQKNVSNQQQKTASQEGEARSSAVSRGKQQADATARRPSGSPLRPAADAKSDRLFSLNRTDADTGKANHHPQQQKTPVPGENRRLPNTPQPSIQTQQPGVKHLEFQSPAAQPDSAGLKMKDIMDQELSLEMELQTGGNKDGEAPDDSKTLLKTGSSNTILQLKNVTGRREFSTQLVRQLQQQSKGEQTGSWQHHRFVLEDGQSLNVAARNIEGALHLQLSSGNTELNKVIQQHINEIRQHLKEQLNIEVDLHFQQFDDQQAQQQSGESSAFSSSDYGPSSGPSKTEQSSASGSSINPTRYLGFNHNEWTA